MNKRANAFKAYLSEKGIEAFQIDEVADDALNTVVFRSTFEINGLNLPLLIILDSSIFGMIRLRVAPKALTATNEAALMKLINEYNKTYKPFKYYVDDEGNVVLDACLLFRSGAFDGDMLYVALDVINDHLQKSYRYLMRVIWA